MYNIYYYSNDNSKGEVLDYLDHLKKSNSKEDRIKSNKIRLYMNLLKEFGPVLGEPFIKKISGEIWELRPLKDRFLFAFMIKNNIIILSHFVKKTQKTPVNEIEKAKRRYEESKKRDDLYE